MRKHWITMVLALALLLSACAPGAKATPTAAGTATAAVTATEAPAAGEAATPAVDPTVAFAASGPAKCTAASGPIMGTPNPTEVSLFPKASDKDWGAGPAEATVTFIVYSDFQCPYCAQLAPVMSQLEKDFPKDVRVVFRHFPLTIHDKALISAQAAEAAGQQGKFMEMGDLLFAKQADWSTLTADEFTAWAEKEAAGLGLDAKKFAADFTSADTAARVKAAQDEGLRAQIPGTPFLLINGRIYQGPRDYFNLSTIVRLVSMEARQFSQCPEQTLDASKAYTATLKTDQGDIVIKLYSKQAPMAVNNFIFLAKQGWYDNVIFHRVIPGFVAQAGDPSGTGYGTPGYAFSNEVTPELRFDQEGVLGMANAGPDSNGSQFFITLGPASNLDGQYTVFGQVIQGMDAAKKLTPRDPSQGGDLPAGSKILSVSIEEK
jgi:cyclophilin family peptidyl-prolyl cis-trans isomerase/protein-disulfide isomerase